MCYRFLLIVIIVLAAVALIGYRQFKAPATAEIPERQESFFPGEEIAYGVKMGPVKMGNSTLNYVGKTAVNGRAVVKIIFKTTGFNFLDQETIYADENDFYPVRVERNLNLWGKKMDIVEDYDSQGNSWRLTKRQGSKVDQETFKSDGRVQNIISLVYFYRQMKDLEVGKSLGVELSNAQVTLQVKKIVDLSVAGKRYKAYLIESSPPRYRVWLDTGERRLPLRIDGSLIGFSNMVMIMREHN